MVWKEPGKDKDPWEEGGQASPDLDKFVGDLHRRFSGLFRRRRRGRQRHRLLLWLTPVAFLGWLLTGCYVVDTGDRGMEFLLGRFQSVTAPGLHWHAPWPLGAAQVVAGVDRGADYVRSYNALLTADGDVVTAEVAVHYRITDLPQYVFGDASPADGTGAADVLGNLTDAAVSQAVAQAKLAELLGTGVDGAAASVATALTAALKRYPIGIEVDRVSFTKVAAPAPLAAAYAAVRQAEVQAQQQSDAADAYAADLLPKARGEADARVEAAKAYATGLVKRAEGDAAAFADVLAAFRRAPAVTRESLYISTYEQILGQVDRVVVMGKDGHVTLSLDKPGLPPKAVSGSKPAAKTPSPMGRP
ncbi:MAG TPA: FtsH protease activity modulator HflK [Gammaproteobacteria bacterium]|nr:FtsH protease activity modulator HflK [Gammaproteobacteria bacterium]